MFKAYTDYPITELGDIAGELAPIREIEVHSFDGNKYCVISVDGVTIEIKSGYIFSEPGRMGVVPHIGSDKIESLPVFDKFGMESN